MSNPADAAKEAAKAHAAIRDLEDKTRAAINKHEAKRAEILANLSPMAHRIVMVMLEQPAKVAQSDEDVCADCVDTRAAE